MSEQNYKIVKEIIFDSAAVDINDDKVVIYTECNTGFIKSQFCLNAGVIEFYDDGTITIYGEQAQWEEMFGNNEFWIEHQEDIKKFCSYQFEEFIVEPNFIAQWLGAEPITYKKPKKHTNVNLRLKKQEDFKMDILHGAKLTIYRGVQRNARNTNNA